MQKLNGREIYVHIVLIIVTTILVYLMANDIFSNIASVRKDKGMVSISQMDLRSHTKFFLQIVLNLSAIIFFWRVKRLGWILTFPVLLFYGFIISYVMIGFGYIDATTTIIGLSGILVFGLGLVFLLIPSTLKKFRIRKMSFIWVLVVIGALGLLYFGII